MIFVLTLNLIVEVRDVRRWMSHLTDLRLRPFDVSLSLYPMLVSCEREFIRRQVRGLLDLRHKVSVVSLDLRRRTLQILLLNILKAKELSILDDFQAYKGVYLK